MLMKKHKNYWDNFCAFIFFISFAIEEISIIPITIAPEVKRVSIPITAAFS